MSVPKINNINYCREWIGVCNSFGDIDYQRRCWFREEGTEMSSYEEDFAHMDFVASDLVDPDADEYLTPECNRLIRELVDRLKKYDNDPETYLNPAGEEELLSDPKWLEIAASARKTKATLEKFLEEIKNVD